MAQNTKPRAASASERSAAIERTGGMLVHLAPGVSLSDEIVADRRTESRAEDQEGAEEVQRLRGRG